MSIQTQEDANSFLVKGLRLIDMTAKLAPTTYTREKRRPGQFCACTYIHTSLVWVIQNNFNSMPSPVCGWIRAAKNLIHYSRKNEESYSREDE